MDREDDIRAYFKDRIKKEQENFLADEEKLKERFQARLRQEPVIAQFPRSRQNRPQRKGLPSGGKGEPFRSTLIAAAAALMMVFGSMAEPAGARYARMPGVKALQEVSSSGELLRSFLSRSGTSRGEVFRQWARRGDGIGLFDTMLGD